METSDPLATGRAAFERAAWDEAYTHLAQADETQLLTSQELDRLGTAAYLTGRDATSTAAWERAHQGFLDDGDVPAAARSAFWVVFSLLHQGESARAAGWLNRTQRLLAAEEHDCVEVGYLLFPVGYRQLVEGEISKALETFAGATAIGQRFGDADLLALARHAQGRVLLRSGDTEAGLALLDEAMVAVTAGETTPMIAGDIYCSVIEACQEIFDVRRATEWTEALSRWCQTQPDLVPYRGQCLVHRSQLQQLHGEWSEAMAEARSACARLSDPPGQPALGLAWYQQAELHRLRGELDAAETTYRRAAERGHVPQPGLSLLCLAQGRLDAAVAAIRVAVDAAGDDPVARAKLLPAQVEILLEANELEEARSAASELRTVCAQLHAPMLEAMAAHAHGMVLLTEGDVHNALVELRRAWTRWWELQAPYDVARVRVLIGSACMALGDAESARLEFAAARQAFEQIGAGPDLRRLDEMTSRRDGRHPSGLSGRELEVLSLVAAGKTNQEIASALVISRHTVRRHVQNIFHKLDVTSRTAATAYAYEHHLV